MGNERSVTTYVHGTQPQITETRTRGSETYFMTGAGIALGLVLVLFVLLFVATQDLRISAIATLAVALCIGVVIGFLWAHNAGSRTTSIMAQNIVESMSAIITTRSPASGQTIDGDFAYVHEKPGFVTSGNQMHRKDRIEAAAVDVWRELYPHTPPTRANIKAVTKSGSDEFCNLVLNYLRDKELVREGGQGKISAWK